MSHTGSSTTKDYKASSRPCSCCTQRERSHHRSNKSRSKTPTNRKTSSTRDDTFHSRDPAGYSRSPRKKQSGNHFHSSLPQTPSPSTPRKHLCPKRERISPKRTVTTDHDRPKRDYIDSIDWRLVSPRIHEGHRQQEEPLHNGKHERKHPRPSKKDGITCCDSRHSQKTKQKANGEIDHALTLVRNRTARENGCSNDLHKGNAGRGEPKKVRVSLHNHQVMNGRCEEHAKRKKCIPSNDVHMGNSILIVEF